MGSARPRQWTPAALEDGRPHAGRSRRSAEEHGLLFELLRPAEIRRRFPVLQAAEGTVGILEPRAGFLDPEACVESALALAANAGAELLSGVTVVGWQRRAGGLVLTTSRGPIECGTMIVAAGPWARDLLVGAGIPLAVERQVMYWFRPA